MKKLPAMLMLSCIITISCAKNSNLEPLIKLSTTHGDVVLKLYAETPNHRDNFVKLVENGFYNGLMFHRVIADFMIQAGDPDSRTAIPGQILGSGDVGYRIPAEFNYPKLYHKKGALAAAREGDTQNPLKESSGCQFYIVQGRTFTDDELNAMENGKKKQLELKLFNKILNSKKDEINSLKPDRNKLDKFRDSIMTKVKEEIKLNTTFKFTEQQRKDYKTIGGTPHLDGEYTVFGEVIEGMAIVTNISKVQTGESDRPINDIIIIEAKINK